MLIDLHLSFPPEYKIIFDEVEAQFSFVILINQRNLSNNYQYTAVTFTDESKDMPIIENASSNFVQVTVASIMRND